MIEKFRSKIALKVEGKNINRFIKKLTTRKINILSLKYISKDEVQLLIYKEDYKDILKVKSIYEILEENTYGYIKIKKLFKLNTHFIVILLVGYILFLLLTNTIFDIEVVHSNKEVRNLLQEELKNNGIKKYTLKKSFKELEKIKEKILNDHPNEIEWLEIETKGTKYLVRVEEREIVRNNDDNKPRHIIAAKDAVIKKVVADKGDILRNTDDYVKQGDIVINGEIMLNEKSMGKVKAEGKIFGEVWYVIKTEYPFVYHEETETGKSKQVYTVKVLNKDFEFTFNKFKNKKIKEEKIISHPLLPIKLVKQNQKETQVKNEILTFDDALIKAEELSETKIKKDLSDNEYIIRQKYLKSTVKDSTIEVEMFFAVYEDITAYQGIE